MAHVKTTDNRSKIINELNKGFRSRRIKAVPCIVASARTSMTAPAWAVADVIRAETLVLPVMIAPCAGELIRFTANAGAWPVNGGTITATVKKAVIADTDVSMTSALSIENTATAVGAAETAVDGVLSTVADALTFVEGQLIYLSVAVSNHAVTTMSTNLIFEIEWVPTEK